MKFSTEPVGMAEYKDLGLVQLDGRKVMKSTFETKVLGFRDIETIYCDPETYLPIRIERDIKWWVSKEYIIENYDRVNFKAVFTKSVNGKQVSEQTFTAEGPIISAILVPFYLRKVKDLDIGWKLVFYLPQKFEAKLVSIDQIVSEGKKISAYHFTSTPDKFEIWISKDDFRLPVIIKGKGGLGYNLIMQEHKITPEK